MKMYLINAETLIGKPNIAIEHRGTILEWDASFFDKKSLVPEDNADIFAEINAYWSTLTMELQDNLFARYVQIRRIFDECWNHRDLSRHLSAECPQLLDMHNIAHMKHWVKFHSTIRVPSKLETEYVRSDDLPGSREQTYLREDYVDLIVLIVLLRTMVPVWSEYIIRTKGEKGNNFKEYYAFHLIHTSQAFVSEAMEKLRVYIGMSIDSDKKKDANNRNGLRRASAILDGVSSEEFPTWILAQTVVRRICISDVRGLTDTSSLVMSIYKYVTSKEKGSENSFSGMVKDKTISGSPDDNNLSKLEGYKVKQDIASGDLVYLEYFMSDPQRVAQLLEPELNPERLNSALQTCREMHNHSISDPQIILLQWVMRPVLAPRAILHLSKNIVIQSLGIAQAVYEHRGHYTAAMLSTAVSDQTESETRISDASARITAELQARLGELFPYAKKPTTRQRIGRAHNQAIASIDNLVDMLSLTPWTLTCDNTLCERTMVSNKRSYTPARDIKNQMAQLVIDLAERRAIKHLAPSNV